MTGEQASIEVDATTVRQLIEKLEVMYPGVKSQLCVNDRLRPGLAVTVNSNASSLGLRQPLSPGDEVHFLPAIGGG